ncbi:hypothetical protein OHR68_43135 [Spirillospora sp. NBC_00431]
MSTLIKAIPRYAKAVASGVTTLGATVGVALADEKITTYEWIGIVVAVLGAAGLVGAIPNKPADLGELPAYRR